MVDAMCGSGTLLLEAALIAHKVAPGLLRTEWALLAWPDCDQDAWQAAWESARGECQLQWSGVIAGCDVHKVSLTFSSAHQHFRGEHHPAVEHIGTCFQERAVLSTLPRALARCAQTAGDPKLLKCSCAAGGACVGKREHLGGQYARLRTLAARLLPGLEAPPGSRSGRYQPAMGCPHWRR